MDSRRLSSAGVLASGILGLPPVKLDRPDREVFHGDEYIEREQFVALLEQNKRLELSNHYGCISAWREDDGRFRGVLMQYRAITEDETFDNLEDAVEWLVSTNSAMVG
jgi:hypothetical protein